MKGKANYLIFAVLTFFIPAILPNYFFAYYPFGSIMLPCIASICFLGGYLSSKPSIMKYLEKTEPNGKVNDTRFYALIFLGMFVLAGFHFSKMKTGEKDYFDKNGTLTNATISDGEQSTTTKVGLRGVRSNTKSTIVLVYKDKSGVQHEVSKEVDGVKFDKYSLGEPIKIRYLAEDPDMIFIVD
jgi:hypothetical protein